MTTTNHQAAQSVTSTNQTKTTKEMVSMKQLTMSNVNGVGTDKAVAVNVRLFNDQVASVVVFGYSPYGGRRTYLSKEVEGKRVRERMTVPAFVNLVQPHLAQADLSKLRHTVNSLKPIYTRNFITCLCMSCGSPVSAAEMDYIQRNADALQIDDFTALCMKCQPQRKTTVVPVDAVKPQAVKPEVKAEAYIPTVQDMITAKSVIADLKKKVEVAPKKARRDIAGSTTMSVTVSMIESIYEMCNAAYGDRNITKAKLISRIQDNIEVIMENITQMNIMPYNRTLVARTTPETTSITLKSRKAKAEHNVIVTETTESIQSVTNDSADALEKSSEVKHNVSEEQEFECDICTLVKPLVYNRSLNHHVCQSCSDAHNEGPLFTPDCGPALDITYDAVSGSMVVDNAESNDFLCATPDCVSLPMHGSTLCPSCTHENMLRALREGARK
jgi:hypothetical protein